MLTWLLLIGWLDHGLIVVVAVVVAVAVTVAVVSAGAVVAAVTVVVVVSAAVDTAAVVAVDDTCVCNPTKTLLQPPKTEEIQGSANQP